MFGTRRRTTAIEAEGGVFIPIGGHYPADHLPDIVDSSDIYRRAQICDGKCLGRRNGRGAQAQQGNDPASYDDFSVTVSHFPARANRYFKGCLSLRWLTLQSAVVISATAWRP